MFYMPETTTLETELQIVDAVLERLYECFRFMSAHPHIVSFC